MHTKVHKLAIAFGFRQTQNWFTGGRYIFKKLTLSRYNHSWEIFTRGKMIAAGHGPISLQLFLAGVK